MASFATVTPANISISPVRLTFDGVDLGGVEGDVTVSIEQSNSEIKVAQYGDSLIDLVNKGTLIKVKARLLEVSAAQIKRLFPASLLGTNGNYFATNVGTKLSAFAKQLVIHPLDRADADLTHDIVLFKAVSMSPAEIPYGPETITGFEIEFVALPDFSVGAQARFAFIGDPAVGLINASAAAAVADGGNTGDGTVGTVSVSNTATKTETITMTCVAEAANGGTFEVVGGDSRALGNAIVGSQFTADDNSVIFTISDGATDFILGDIFTVATTAANYI